MSTSLTNLITQTRDYIGEATADRWTDAELTRYINQGLRQVQSQLQAANEDYFLRVEVATAAAGTYEMAFPADIWGNKLRDAWYYDQSTVATGTAYRLDPAALDNVYGNLNVSGVPKLYTYHAGFFRFAPVMQNSGAFRFVYAMKVTALSAGSDTIGQIADEHADCIALYAGIMAKNRVGADAGLLTSMYKTRMEQIQNDVQPTAPFVLPQRRID
jgi:hypothetical protein